MPANVPDSDITFVYVKELSESIRNVSTIMQGLSSELHQHALALHQLKTEFATVKSNFEILMNLVRDGQNPLASRVAEVERDIKEIHKDREAEEERHTREYDSRKNFKIMVWGTLITGLISIALAVMQYMWPAGQSAEQKVESRK